MKHLVVFYSLGGNTRSVARKIALSLKADLLEIRTVKTYPDDYDVLVGLGKRETETGYIPQLQPYKVDLSKYDAVIIGTPVWWYTLNPLWPERIGRGSRSIPLRPTAAGSVIRPAISERRFAERRLRPFSTSNSTVPL